MCVLQQAKKFTKIAHLCEVEITYNHNHPVNSAHSLSFCDVSEETKAKFYKYFACGHSAASARHQHKFHLQLSADVALVEKLLANRATNPHVQEVSRLFQAWRFQQHDSDHGADMFDCLEEVDTTKLMMMVEEQLFSSLVVRVIQMRENH